MKVIKEQNIRKQTVLAVAQKMMIAARTAPKGCGVDNLEIVVITGDNIKRLADKMVKLVDKKSFPEFFRRDAQNILSAQAVLLIWTAIKPLDIPNCGQCGFENCAEKNKHSQVPCAFNTGDLGIAIGSAVSVAMDNRVDNRVMFSIGKVAVEEKLLGEYIKIAYGIPLSVAAKNPFFDRG